MRLRFTFISPLMMAAMALLLSFPGSAQQRTDSLTLHKSFWGTKFTRGEEVLRISEVNALMEPGTEAYTYFKKARTNAVVSTVIGCVGGVLVGWPVGAALGGGDPRWGLAAAGGGLFLLSIPFTSAFNKNAEQAIVLYNKTLSTARHAVHISFGAGSAGLGIAFSL